MSSSASQWTTLRPIVISSLVLLCFLVLFYTYYNHDFKFPHFNKDESSHLCSVGRAQTEESNPNCSTELLFKPPRNGTQRIQATAADTEPDTIVLIWMWPFGNKYDLNCSAFNITGCHLTDNKSLYHKAHGVLFHHLNINRNLANLPKEPRPWFQKWIWLNMESPANSPLIPDLNQLFNLTCNYRRDSSIPVPYGYLVPRTSQDESFKLPAKDKLVCWIVSNWNWRYRRVQFYDEMKKHIKIHAYGNAFGQRLSGEDYTKIISSCKFYLSFENSAYEDYMTEKLFRPLLLGSVPIVLGPSRQNYEDHVPGDSFIHVDDFPSAKKLAERIHYLHQNNTEYMKYFNWTNKFKIKLSFFGKEHACNTCSYLQKHRQCQTFLDLNKWYWC